MVQTLENKHCLPGINTLDVRKLPIIEGKLRVIEAFESMKPGDDFCILCNRDPLDLQRQFQMEFRDRFEWHILEGGPNVWRILLVKKGTTPGKRFYE